MIAAGRQIEAAMVLGEQLPGEVQVELRHDY